VDVVAGIREAWNYRELAYFLGWRDVKVRYKQTALGVAWALFQPLAMTAVFTLFLGRAGVPSPGMPYALFVLCGLLPWQLFAYGISESSNSLVANERLITKVYFPRLIIPASAVLAGLIDFCVGLSILVVLMIVYRVTPAWSILAVPLFVLLALLAAFGAGLWLSALNVRYRDVRYILGFLVQVWLFITPVVYPLSVVAPRWRVLYALNPMTAVVEGFRWSVAGGAMPDRRLVAASVIATVVVLAGGLRYFQKTEETFADVI
jgi:lipopolysaccharide transport system permease protein